MGAKVDPGEAPTRISASDFGTRRRIHDGGVPLAFRIVAVQGVLAVLLATMFLLLGRAQAVSGLLAGVVVVAPNVGFAWRVAATSAPAGQELDAARRLLGSGVVKVLLTFGLLVVVFAWFRPEPLAFFATMIALQAVYWFTPALARR
jgi:ATP synthase protein I